MLARGVQERQAEGRKGGGLVLLFIGAVSDEMSRASAFNKKQWGKMPCHLKCLAMGWMPTDAESSGIRTLSSLPALAAEAVQSEAVSRPEPAIARVYWESNLLPWF